tara:strand:- start:327 stop:1058 length:732 start_codon:yes stop_codon:yes gene_type:complete
METFKTKYGLITLKSNEEYIIDPFRKGGYWEDNDLIKLKPYIDCDKNILEIGGHSGTSTIAYSTFLDKGKIYVYEPQAEMFNILNINIKQNNLEDKIFSNNKAVFCYNGKGNMNKYTLDGSNIHEPIKNNDKILNYGGMCVGGKGEEIDFITIDSMDIDNIGFIHMDAQGSEPFIFSQGLELISKNRPVLYYERPEKRFMNNIIKNYPEYENLKDFNIKKYCLEKLNYEEIMINDENILLVPF